ncbi:ABC transporter substrate-binding protein [Ramlibacter albus]|uniref:ABC transporter substrate-binding protein n=1 Tax=Ramlibacter albus TaxID=2079448 RepID=A0A923S288_9BURK|nr:ABC transporter substrate-binding protein [Ramlibacter albus]MBC5765110.1 ABC transporter substrate-binding protein [Ramlibacter albus]
MLALHPLACIAQAGPARIELLYTGSEKEGARVAAAFRSLLQGVGLADGKDYVLDYTWADGHYERFPALAQSAAARKPALILVTTIASARAAQQATSTIPIVMTGLNDPVGNRLVASYAQPGGNITGTASMSDDYIGKLLELAREIIPGTKRIAVLVNPLNTSNGPIFRTFAQLARSAGIAADMVEISAPEQIDAALAALLKNRPDALITGLDSSHVAYRARFAQFASTHAIPIVSVDGNFSESGAVVTYTAQAALARMAVVYVQKILAGAKPADLPVQQPTSFDLVVNMRVAQALKLKVPQTVLMRATRLIE